MSNNVENGAADLTPITWADGNGRWHVLVNRNAVSPVTAARRALRTEILMRYPDAHKGNWMKCVRVEMYDTDETICYAER